MNKPAQFETVAVEVVKPQELVLGTPTYFGDRHPVSGQRFPDWFQIGVHDDHHVAVCFGIVIRAVPAGTEITVTNTAGQELYDYTTTDNYGFNEVSDSPTVVSGTSIDSGLIPFLHHSVYIDYGNDTTDISPFIP